MHSRLLKVSLAALIVCAMGVAAHGAATQSAPASKGKFDQKQVLMDMWTAPDDTVVGTVNGISVTKRELLKTLWFWNAPTQLQDLLTQKMIQDAAQKAGISLSQKELDEKVNDALKRSNMSSVDDLLNQYRITWYRFMAANKINGLAEKTVRQSLKVADADLAEWIKTSHILVRPPADEKDKAKGDEIAKKKIDEIYAKLKAGGDFVALANEFTEDPSNVDGDTKKGGDLGWITKGRMVQDFEAAAFKLKAGEYSEPVKTFYGYHLIRVEKLGKDASPADKAMLKKMILEQKLQPETGRWYSETVAKSRIDNKLMVEPEKKPVPAVQPRPAPRPQTPPKTEARPEPKPEAPPAPKPAEPASSEKPDTPPPPPPPAQ